MLNVFYDSYRILFSVYSDGAFLKQAMSDVFIEEKNRAHTTKICYGVLDKDIEFEYAFSKLCDKRPKQAVRIILKISSAYTNTDRLRGFYDFVECRIFR